MARQPSATEWRKRVAHGMSRGEKCASAKAPSGATEFRLKRIFFRRCAARLLTPPQPTADAVGYLLPLLRSYFPPLSKTGLSHQICGFTFRVFNYLSGVPTPDPTKSKPLFASLAALGLWSVRERRSPNTEAAEVFASESGSR